MNLWGITDRGSVRKENQDAYQTVFLREGLGLGVVCDGMGGALAGNVASTLALETFVGDLTAQCAEGLPQEPMDALLHAAERANEVVYRRSREDSACHGMGTTLVAAMSDGAHVWVLNIGDSRCYQADGEEIRQVTRDHSLVEDLVARGDITPEQARSHPRKNLITRALGVEPSVTPDLYTVEGQPGSFLLLCSDGLSNTVSDQELLYEVIHGGAPDSCCQRLLDIALIRGAPDNVTAVLFQL